MIECIIFNCDGTLVDSEYLCNLALEQKLVEYNVHIAAHELMRKFKGKKLATILSSIESENSIFNQCTQRGRSIN